MTMVYRNYNQEIDEIMDEQDDTYELRQDQTWGVHDLSTAVWADNLIREKELAIAEKEKIANDNIEQLKVKIEKLEQWKVDATKKERSDIEFFKTHLHVYHMRVLDEEKANKAKKLSKTIKLPYRDLTCKAQQPTILVNGKEPDNAKADPQLIQFVKENNPEFIKEEVKWGDFKKTLSIKDVEGKKVYVDESGQLVDFIELTDREDAYDWKVKQD